MRYDATTQAVIDAQRGQPEREWGAEDPRRRRGLRRRERVHRRRGGVLSLHGGAPSGVPAPRGAQPDNSPKEDTMPKASDYRKAGRYSQQDKRANERRRAIETAEDAVGEARQARWEDPSAENFEAVRAAEAALYELDPTNHMFD